MTIALAIGAIIIGLALVAWSAFRISGLIAQDERFGDEQ